MREEVDLQESLLKNRWGRDQKIKPGDEVRLAPFESQRPENETPEHNEFVSMMTEGLNPGETYTIHRIVRFPDDGTVVLYLDIGNGRIEGYYAEYLQAIDPRKIKAVEFPLNNPRDVVKHLKTITDKKCRVMDCTFKEVETVKEETHPSNEWIILPATAGKCKVTMEGEPREVKLNPDKVIVIPIPAGKRHSLLPLSGFSSYMVLCEEPGKPIYSS